MSTIDYKRGRYKTWLRNRIAPFYYGYPFDGYPTAAALLISEMHCRAKIIEQSHKATHFSECPLPIVYTCIQVWKYTIQKHNREQGSVTMDIDS